MLGAFSMREDLAKINKPCPEIEIQSSPVKVKTTLQPEDIHMFMLQEEPSGLPLLLYLPDNLEDNYQLFSGLFQAFNNVCTGVCFHEPILALWLSESLVLCRTFPQVRIVIAVNQSWPLSGHILLQELSNLFTNDSHKTLSLADMLAQKDVQALLQPFRESGKAVKVYTSPRSNKKKKRFHRFLEWLFPSLR
jgi:hypothetical protein